jgi:nitroreductase
MELSEVLRRRRMVRRYDPSRPVPPQALERLLVAALRAPSAGHTQGVSLLVLSEPRDVDTYWRVTSGPGEPDRWLQGMRTAPVLVLVWTSAEAYLDRYARPDKGWADRDPARWSAPYWYVDAGMASMAALLSAVDSELGACFFGVPVDRIAAVREAFGVPAEQLSVGVISIGYPDSADLGRTRVRRVRRRPEERLHRGRWMKNDAPDSQELFTST